MATIPSNVIEVKTPDKGTFVRFTENASQAAKKGEFVTLSSGKVSALSGTDPGANTIAGIATHDFENVAAPANRGAVIFVPDRDCLFEVTAKGVSAQTNIGTRFESIEESDIVKVDLSATTTLVWLVVDIVDISRQVVGDTDVRVVAKLIEDRLQLSR